MLSPEIENVVARLSRGSEGIEAVMNQEESSHNNRFSRALNSLANLAKTERMPIAIVGDLAAIHHGHAVATQDIDIAVGKSDLDRLIKLAVDYGFKVTWESKKGWHTLEFGDVEINVVPEGGRAKDEAPTLIPGARAMGVEEGLDYAKLESWCELKISSNRQKDRGHLVEVLKRVSADATELVSNHLSQVHVEYANAFAELLEQAKSEQDQENKRR